MINKKLKKIVRKIHLYLGLASGLVVFIISITGACWVFKEEILLITEGKLTVEAESKSFITPTQAKEYALQIFPNRAIHGTVYGHSTDPIEVIFYEREPIFYRSVFLNPYNGKHLKTTDHRAGFFWFVLDGHLNLWLPKGIGSQITSYGTMIFVIMLISGIILWWPKNKKNRAQRTKFDWKSTTKWRRKNFDLHAVVGFYVSFFSLILAYTGLMMAFGWVFYLTYLVWGGDKSPRFIIPENEIAIVKSLDQEPKSIDKLVPKLISICPNYKKLEVHYPKSDTSSIYVEVSNQEGVRYNSDFRFFDQNTLEEIKTPSIFGKHKDGDLADKVIRMTYDIHIGSIGGLLGKIIAFIISLLSASLPVSGVILWWGRKKKKQRPNPKLVETIN